MVGTLEDALGVLQKYGKQILQGQSKNSLSNQYVQLLETIKPIDEQRVLEIAQVVQHIHAFSQLVTDNVSQSSFGQRYIEIEHLFTSVREDFAKRIKQVDEGKYTLIDKLGLRNIVMRLTRGMPNQRIKQAGQIFTATTNDNKADLDKETEVLGAYDSFSIKVQEARQSAEELFAKQKGKLDDATAKFTAANDAVTIYSGSSSAERVGLEKARDLAKIDLETETSRWQTLKNFTEFLTTGYELSRALKAQVKQTHDIKDQVWQRALSFFSLNEQNYALLSMAYTSKYGLIENSRAVKVMGEGLDKSLEQMATIGGEAEKQAMPSAYGPLNSPEAAKKFIEHLYNTQIEIEKGKKELGAKSAEVAAIFRKLGQELDQKMGEILTPGYKPQVATATPTA